MRVYAIVAGVGRRDAAGAWVELDTRPVERLAARTGGTFHRARNAGAVGAVYDRIDRLERSPTTEPRHIFRDRYLGFLFARGASPEAVEESLRAAHARLRFDIEPID